MNDSQWEVHNPEGRYRVVVTKMLPGDRWLKLLVRADCRVEIFTGTQVLGADRLAAVMDTLCHGVIGQLTETWTDELFKVLREAGGRVFSNCAVGFDNVDVEAATRYGIAVGNTPGVLTATTAEMAAALTLAVARRVGEAERFMRAGRYQAWLPTLFLGKLLEGRTVGVIGAGRIGCAYARIMATGLKMDVVYFSRSAKPQLENYIGGFNRFLQSQDGRPLRCQRLPTVEAVLAEADCVSLHTSLSPETRHLINAERLALMKPDAVLINTSRGPVIDETALVAHCQNHPDFRAGLDVFEDEPAMAPGLTELENVLVVPHIASATGWTREGMATLAAANVAAILQKYPVWQRADIEAFLQGECPRAAPSVINAEPLGLDRYSH